MKNLLMSAAIGLSINDIKNFIVSFRSVNTKDDFIVLVDEQTKNASYDLFIKHFVHPIACDKEQFKTSPINSRHFFYLNYLKTNQLDYKNVLVTDTRDFMFQLDPFSFCPEEEHVFVFEEDSNFKLMYESTNRFWLKSIYGEERVKELDLRNIVSGGAILGTRQQTTKMLEILCHEMSIIDRNYFETDIADQPVLNHICYSELVKTLPLQIKKNGDIGANIGLSLTREYAKDLVYLDVMTKKIIVNGMTPAMVHQYDRNPILLEAINNKFFL